MDGDRQEEGKSPKHEGLSPMAKGIHSAQPWMDALWKLTGGAVVGVVGGWLMDRYLGTAPWGVVGLSTLGIGVGFYAFIRAALRLSRK